MLGQNPNGEIREEYIANLQQQVHFMELEMKILKEKVFEDEKKSGIGSLFDDEKTSHQHISLLKTKYMEMRTRYEKLKQDANKRKLNVIGEQFVLDSQITTLNDQSNKQSDNKRDHEDTHNKERFATEKKLKDTQ